LLSMLVHRHQECYRRPSTIAIVDAERIEALQQRLMVCCSV